MPSKMPHRPSDSGTNTAWQSSMGHLPDREKLLMHSACCMHHISMYIHRAHLGHIVLGHPLAHMSCLWLLDKGWWSSQVAALQSPQHWPAPHGMARSSNGSPQPAEPGRMGSLNAPHRGNRPSPWGGQAAHLIAISFVPTPGRSHREAILPSLHSKPQHTLGTGQRPNRHCTACGGNASSSSSAPLLCTAHLPAELCTA